MNTASFQISLELGDEGIRQDRWILANLISPLVLATFACSPSENGVSTRALSWQALDLTRVGFPSKFSNEISNPQEAWSEAVLKAYIALFNLAPDTMKSAKTQLSFEDWIKNGHPLYGWPTIDDLIYHISTLYFEVRPRGYIELRSCDMLPDIFQPVPVVLITALFYGSRALKASIDLLVDKAPELTDLWKRAATFGLRDPEIANLSYQLWEIALNGVSDLSETYFGEENIQKAKDFLEKYTFRRRMLADDLEELQQSSPKQAIEWASLGQNI